VQSADRGDPDQARGIQSIVTTRGYEEQLGRQLYAQERYEEAESAFRLALTKHPDDAKLYLAIALCIDPEERPDEALSLFQRAVELDPMLADGHNGVGVCETDLGQAEAAFRRAIVIEPGTSEFHANLGVCLLRQGRPGDAEQCIRRAVELEPGNLSLVCDWCELLIELNRYRDAEMALRKITARLGDRRGALEKRAWWYYFEQRWGEAEARFEGQRGPIRPDEAWLYFVYAKVLRAQHKTTAAVDAVRIAIALAPRVADFHDELGQLLETLRRPEQAGIAYTRASALLG